MRRAILLAALAALLSAAALASASSAGAASYVEAPCSGQPTDELFWWDWSGGDNWYLSDACPTGYGIYLAGDGHIGDPGFSATMDTAISQIDGISAQIFRADPDESGIEVGLKVCRNSDCSALITPDPSGLIELQRDDSDPDVEIPAGANTVVVQAWCTLETCPGRNAVGLANLQITRSDDSPPLFELANVDATDAPYYGPPQWKNGPLHFLLQGDDLESGLAYWRFDLAPISLCQPVRAYGIIVPDCTMLDAHAPFELNAADVPDGTHQFEVTAVNMAGLSATHSVVMKTDVTPPARPSQFKVTPRFGAWVNSRDVAIAWKNTGETAETDTESGIAGYRFDVDPDFATDNPPPDGAADPVAQYVASPGADHLQYRFPTAGTWAISIVTVDRAGNESEAGEAYVDIDTGRLPAPDVAALEPINAQSAADGVTIDWSYPSIPVSGVCGHSFAFSGQGDFNPGEDPTKPTIAGSGTSVTLTPTQVQALAEKPQRLHIRGYSCAGIAGAIARPPVIVDFTPPAVSLAPASGIVNSTDPVLIGVIDAKAGTTQSGFASVDCAINGDPAPCSLEGGVDLVPGANHLVVTAIDHAGNSTSASADFTSDAVPPEGWFEPADPTDPTLVRATARDTGSGVASATIEYQPLGGGPWTRIGPGFVSDSPSTAPVTLSARIPDDGQLADDGYRLRLAVKDAGGSAAMVSLRSDGAQAGFTIPVRQESVVTAGLSQIKGAKAATSTTTRLMVGYGRSAQLAGRLTTRAGAPIAGAALSLTAIQQGAPPRVVASATTDAKGSYSVTIPAGATRTIVVRYAGGPVARSTSVEAKLLVAGRVSLKVSHKSVRGGKGVVLSGRVSYAGASLPLRGKVVELAFRASGGRTWKQTRRCDAAGHFSFLYSYVAKRRPVRFSVRAISTTEAGWPYETGLSPWTRFVVAP